MTEVADAVLKGILDTLGALRKDVGQNRDLLNDIATAVNTQQSDLNVLDATQKEHGKAISQLREDFNKHIRHRVDGTRKLTPLPKMECKDGRER